jgi:hypothetical protein
LILVLYPHHAQGDALDSVGGVAFTTFIGTKWLKKMREWTNKDLATTNKPKLLERAFLFTNLTQRLDPCSVWLGSYWYTPYDEDKLPIALLAVG